MRWWSRRRNWAWGIDACGDCRARCVRFVPGIVAGHSSGIERGGAASTAMEQSDPADRRPMVVVAKTTKGWWPAAVEGRLGEAEQIVGYPSHPYGQKMNSPYFIALAESFERRYGVTFAGIRGGVPASERERLIQFKTNIDCGGCVARVTPRLNETKGIQSWKVDTDNPDKILTVETEALGSENIIEVVKKVGFNIEPLKK